MSFYSPFQFKTVNYRSKFVRMSFDLAHIFPHLASADAFLTRPMGGDVSSSVTLWTQAEIAQIVEKN